uniref:Protein sprouty n=1 Tax=Dendroctonus ponderosae TaxID=77166 RepID=A0AAR5P225_DENPD
MFCIVAAFQRSDDGHARHRPDRTSESLSAPGPGMDGNGFPSAPLRGPGGPVPISIPLTTLRPVPASVTLTAPRPEGDRRDNEYVETPLRGPITPSSPVPLHRPPAPSPPQVPINKQPVAFSKTSPAPSCGTSRPSIMCTTCGRCKCATCRAPKPLPECWSCHGGCLLSADSMVDYVSCLCCVKGLFYHCSEADDMDSSCADDPCGCGPDRRVERWSCLAALVCALPCL